MYKVMLLLSGLMLLFAVSYSQKRPISYADLPIGHYWGISVTPSVVNKLKIEGDREKYKLDSKYRFGGDAMVSYHNHFAKNYSVIIGIGAEAIVAGLDYDIDKDYFTPPTAGNISVSGLASREVYFNARAEVEIERQWYRKLHRYWLTALGISLMYSPEGILDTVTHGFYPPIRPNYYFGNLDINNYGKPWVNFHISAGQAWVLRSGNMFQAKLKLNVSPNYFIHSSYQFRVGNEPDETGNFKANGSYLGISFAYVMTRQRQNRIDAFLEKNKIL